MSPRAGAATAGYFLRAVFDGERLRLVFFGGTLAPSLRASERPMAMACLRLVTFRPEPDFSVPRFFSCIAFATFFDAFLPYLRPDDFVAFFAIVTSGASKAAKSGPGKSPRTAICYTPVA